jgi:hypothetical protein
VAEQRKAWVYGRSLAGITGTNPSLLSSLLSGRGLCGALTTRPEASYRVAHVRSRNLREETETH